MVSRRFCDRFPPFRKQSLLLPAHRAGQRVRVHSSQGGFRAWLGGRAHLLALGPPRMWLGGAYSALIAPASNVAAAFRAPVLPKTLVALCLSITATTVLLLPFAVLSGFVRRRTRHLPAMLQARVLIASFFTPALLEETVYRAAMLPRRTDDEKTALAQLWSAACGAGDRDLAWRTGGALAVFVAMHPANGILLRPKARAVFCDWRFNTAAAILGAACSVLYLETGCVWAPAVLHWLVVAVWLIGFDGLERMHMFEKATIDA